MQIKEIGGAAKISDELADVDSFGVAFVNPWIAQAARGQARIRKR